MYTREYGEYLLINNIICLKRIYSKNSIIILHFNWNSVRIFHFYSYYTYPTTLKSFTEIFLINSHNDVIKVFPIFDHLVKGNIYEISK